MTAPAAATLDALAYARAWAEAYPLTDRQLSPLGLRAIDALRPAPGDTVIDVGCGAGQTLLQLAERVGPGGRVIGVEVAPLLVEVARRRTAALGAVRVIAADAENVDLPSASADAVFSRFGVMVFANPVAAFANFRRILKPGGQLAFCCWRSLAENEIDCLPLAASGLQSEVDSAPFSFADPAVVHDVLAAAGFRDIAIAPHEEAVSSGGLDEMTAVLLKVGPLGRILRRDPALRPAAGARVRAALAARGDPARVALRAAIWVVTARVGP